MDIHETLHGVDLHVHSEISDGNFSVEKILEHAVEKQMRAIAITDHNLLVPNVDELNKKFPIELITGCEFGTNFVFSDGVKKEIHIVGLFFDSKNEKILDILSRNTQDRSQYVRAYLDLLKERENIDLSYEEMEAENPQTEYLGRMHIAAKLCQLGYTSCVNEAFDRYIGAEGSCRVDSALYIHYVDMVECVKAILEAGGIPILAHLFFYQLTEEKENELLQAFKEASGDFGAMEVLYSFYDADQRMVLKAYADTYHLAYSAGSDSHGRPDQDIVSFPYEILDNLKRLKYKLDTNKNNAKEETTTSFK